MNIDPMKSLDTLHRCGPLYAAAKAERTYIEESLRSIKALQMQESDAPSSAAKEMAAYASEPYRTAVLGLRAAVEKEEALKWKLVTAQAAIELFRTLEASNRRMDKAAA
jgi:hypothetical protein